MKQMRTGRQLAGVAIAGLLVAGPAGAASGALAYYPTSVVPTLPSPEEVRAMRDAERSGILSTLLSAYRRSVGQGWAGVPAVERRLVESPADVVHESMDRHGASAAPIGAPRPARPPATDARPDN
jgi:hypothetical protein